MENETIEIAPFLSEIEPFTHTVNGIPVKTITYTQNHVLIEWFTPRELANLRVDWDDIL